MLIRDAVGPGVCLSPFCGAHTNSFLSNSQYLRKECPELTFIFYSWCPSFPRLMLTQIR